MGLCNEMGAQDGITVGIARERISSRKHTDGGKYHTMESVLAQYVLPTSDVALLYVTPIEVR